MPDEIQQPAQQPQVTTSQGTNWKKIGLTVLFILVVTRIIAGVYWFFILNKTPEDSDLTGPVPKPSTPIATDSAKEATPSSKNTSNSSATYENDEFRYKVENKLGLKLTDAKQKGKSKMYFGISDVDTLFSNQLSKISFQSDDGVCQITVLENPKKLTLDQWITSTQPPDYSYIVENVGTKLDGVKAKKLSIFHFDHNSTAIVTSHKGYIYSLGYRESKGNDNFTEEEQNFQQTCEDLFATFKFLD
jgi:hypothetical protein